MHHFNDGPSEELESAGRKSVVDGLDAFYTSSALDFLQTTNRKDWLDVNNANATVPFVDATVKLGLGNCRGLRIYTPYDLAFAFEDNFYLVDWKTGKYSTASYQSCRKQLTAYSLFALNLGRPLSSVKVVPFFLRPDSKWLGHPVQHQDLDAICKSIEDHHTQEMSMVQKMQDEHGNYLYYADFEDFQPQPKPSNCRLCNFLPICQAGKEVVGAQKTLDLAS
jgi:hypothetical protein